MISIFPSFSPLLYLLFCFFFSSRLSCLFLSSTCHLPSSFLAVRDLFDSSGVLSPVPLSFMSPSRLSPPSFLSFTSFLKSSDYHFSILRKFRTFSPSSFFSSQRRCLLFSSPFFGVSPLFSPSRSIDASLSLRRFAPSPAIIPKKGER
ncbi:hypothetical protein CSUI_007080, partial [Cystoisospora suis]